MQMQALDQVDQKSVQRLGNALESRGIQMIFAANRRTALTSVLQLIPLGSAVAHSPSMTLKVIGLIDYFRQPDGPYQDLNAEWQREPDSERRRRV